MLQRICKTLQQVVSGWTCSVLLRPLEGTTEPRPPRRLQAACSEARVRGGAGPGGSAVRTTENCEHRVRTAPSVLPAAQPVYGAAGAVQLGRGPAQDPGSLPGGPEFGLRLRFRSVSPGRTQCTPGGESADPSFPDQSHAWHLFALASPRVPSIPAKPRTCQEPTSKIFILAKCPSV